MKKTKFLSSFFCVIILLAGCTVSPSSSIVSSSGSISVSAGSHSDDDEPVEKAQSQALYDAYMAQIEPAIGRFFSYSMSRPDLPDESEATAELDNELDIETRQVVYNGFSSTMTRFSAEDNTILQYALECTAQNSHINVLYYPINENLTYCQEVVSAFSAWPNAVQQEYAAANYVLSSYIRDDKQGVLYQTVPILGMLIQSDEQIVLNMAELELLFATGIMPEISSYPATLSSGTDSIPVSDLEIAKDIYAKYSAILVSVVDMYVGQETAPQATQMWVDYAPQPSLMTEIKYSETEQLHYYIESYYETRKVQEIFYQISDTATCCLSLEAIYADWSWSTNQRGDIQEYTMLILVRDDEAGTQYQLIPELEIAIEYTEYNLPNFIELETLFIEGQVV